MAFEMFDKNQTKPKTKVKASEPVVEKDRPSKARRSPWVQFIKTGLPDRPGYMLIFGSVALETFGLSVGDHVRLGFDPETGEVGVQKDPTNEGLILGRHGNSERRLRASVTKFFRKYPELVNLEFPHKVNARKRKGRGGWLVFDTRPTADDVVVEQVPIQGRGPGRPRKTSAPVSVEVADTPRRGPGRPRKTEMIPAPVKRGRGRPRKESAVI